MAVNLYQYLRRYGAARFVSALDLITMVDKGITQSRYLLHTWPKFQASWMNYDETSCMVKLMTGTPKHLPKKMIWCL